MNSKNPMHVNIQSILGVFCFINIATKLPKNLLHMNPKWDKFGVYSSVCISHVKSIHIMYKMAHIVGSHNLAHLVFHYINRQFLVILGPTLVTLGTILGMK